MELQIAYWGPTPTRATRRDPRVLSIPGCVLGPGHNCVILGPDRQTEYIVYHAWDTNMEVRQMFLDRSGWRMARAAQDPPGRRKLLSAEVMCERVDETRLRINDE